MSVEWDSLILGGNELKTVGPATENARWTSLVWTCGTNSRGAPAERIGLAVRAARPYQVSSASVLCRWSIIVGKSLWYLY